MPKPFKHAKTSEQVSQNIAEIMHKIKSTGKLRGKSVMKKGGKMPENVRKQIMAIAYSGSKLKK